MTKLADKLRELGYEYTNKYHYGHVFQKILDNECSCSIILTNNMKSIYESYVDRLLNAFYHQDHIDDLQEAFNILQQDLEVLKEYERLD